MIRKAVKSSQYSSVIEPHFWCETLNSNALNIFFWQTVSSTPNSPELENFTRVAMIYVSNLKFAPEQEKLFGIRYSRRSIEMQHLLMCVTCCCYYFLHEKSKLLNARWRWHTFSTEQIYSSFMQSDCNWKHIERIQIGLKFKKPHGPPEWERVLHIDIAYQTDATTLKTTRKNRTFRSWLINIGDGQPNRRTKHRQSDEEMHDTPFLSSDACTIEYKSNHSSRTQTKNENKIENMETPRAFNL